jgi:hypothetical protein
VQGLTGCGRIYREFIRHASWSGQVRDDEPHKVSKRGDRLRHIALIGQLPIEQNRHVPFAMERIQNGIEDDSS